MLNRGIKSTATGMNWVASSTNMNTPLPLNWNRLRAYPVIIDIITTNTTALMEMSTLLKKYWENPTLFQANT